MGAGGTSAGRVRRLGAAGRQTLRGLISRAVEGGHAGGAVAAVGDSRGVFWQEAFGVALSRPRRAMRRDTIFDLASLTKVVATAPAVMLLVERGEVVLSDAVARFIPAFGAGGASAITIRHLLTHTSGLPALGSLGGARTPAGAVEKIAHMRLLSGPGARIRYSDVGFMALADVVRVVAGQGLDEFCARNIYGPLGMGDTCFNPCAEAGKRCAQIETEDGRRLAGRVSDPRAAAVGGVAGHAGLFSTAGDLAAFARMMLNEGAWRGGRILSEASVCAMTASQVEIGGENRGLGWDISSSYSSPKGDLLGARSYGHSGYTGTSLWIDPERDVFIVLLTNWNHGRAGGNANRLRAQVANAVAANIEGRK